MPLAEFTEQFPYLVTRLCNQRLSGRIAHSWIVRGEDLDMLKRFVQAWLQGWACTALTAHGDSCGACQNCQAIVREEYSQMMTIKPVSKSRQIVVDDMHDLEHWLFMKSSNAKRIGIIWEADRLSLISQNTFLKTLEEPPSSCIIVLVTINPEILIPTIRSRCLTMTLRTNRNAYNFPGHELLDTILIGLQKGTGAMAAIQGAGELLQILQGFKSAYKDDKKPVGRKRRGKDEVIAGDIDIQDAVTAAMEAQRNAAYLGQREQFLSAIHTWFGQQYFLANGVDPILFPHPELSPSLTNPASSFSLTPDEALRQLQVTEAWIKTMRYNIDESIAIQDLCQSLCIKI